MIIVGSFLVPVTMAAFALSRPRAGYLTTEEVTLGFFAAGTFAVATAALLETYLLPSASGTFISVGAIEEIGKGAVLLAVAHQVHHREPRDGIVLGIVVGAGFAAFESAGYALQAMLDHLDHLDDREHPADRGVPCAARAVRPHHVDRAARGALFASSRGGRFHVTRRLVLTLLGVVTLHALWDQSYGWAVMLTNGLITNEGWHLLWPNAQLWVVAPTGEKLGWFNALTTRCCGPTRSLASRGSWSPGVTTPASSARPPRPRPSPSRASQTRRA